MKSYNKWLTLCMGAVVLIGLAATVGLADQTQGIVKWSQPPEWIGTGLILGWDQPSMVLEPIVADDFLCKDPLPISDLHWWGSYPLVELGTVPRHPDRFIIRFWSDVKAGEDTGMPWSHPGQMLHEVVCDRDSYSVEQVGYDINVPLFLETEEIEREDEAFQYNQKFKPEEFFDQVPGTIYWVSIQAQYDDPVDTDLDLWGWKTRPWFFNDDAVSGLTIWADQPEWVYWEEIYGPDGLSWDMAFELTVVPEPSSLVLLGMGAVGFVACIWRRRRRG